MTTGAKTTEPGHHNGEFVKDVRVSPIDGGVGFVEEDELSRAARLPGLEPADLLRGHAEQHEVGVVTVKTAVTVHHVRALYKYHTLHLIFTNTRLHKQWLRHEHA